MTQDSALAYEHHAHDFLKARDTSSIGSQVVHDWVISLPQDSHVIEIACGGGFPVSRELINAGIQLWAIDSSATLLSQFKSRFPKVPTLCEKVQDSVFFSKKFNAAVAIGLIFLLPEDEQVSVIKRISDIVLPGGRFLFTAPIEIGSWEDITTGIKSQSLGQQRYTEILHDAGFRIIGTYKDEGKSNYYDTEKVR